MRVIVCDNYEDVSEQASKIVASQIILNPESVLGLATGSTPVGMYEKLGKMYADGELDFSRVTTFNLDEYYPIKKSNPQSYDYFMNETLFSKINIDKANTHIPNGETSDPLDECENYERLIKQHGGIDLQILGIGQNGHIGFNEPDFNLNSVTHLTDLTESTIESNARFFNSKDEIPKQALTMGISTILKSKKIVLLASGASKSKVVSELLHKGINTNVPATMLKVHSDVVLICDKDAYSGVRLGVDIGGTNIKFAVVDHKKLIYKSQIETNRSSTDAIIESIAAGCKQIIDKFPIKTVGVGTPGNIIDGIVNAGNLPLKDINLGKELKKHINLPITVDNDANCAALGEAKMGAGKIYENIVMVTLGTGIGGGIIINRHVYNGNYCSGELGHMIVEPKGIPCQCGLSGCWEQYASVTALIRQATVAAISNPDSILYSVYEKNGKKLNGELIFAAFDGGCPVAAKVIDEYTSWIALGITNIVNIFGPDAVILAGAITRQGDKLLKPIKEKVSINRAKVEILISDLQNDAGALGAAML